MCIRSTVVSASANHTTGIAVQKTKFTRTASATASLSLSLEKNGIHITVQISQETTPLSCSGPAQSLVSGPYRTRPCCFLCPPPPPPPPKVNNRVCIAFIWLASVHLLLLNPPQPAESSSGRLQHSKTRQTNTVLSPPKLEGKRLNFAAFSCSWSVC